MTRSSEIMAANEDYFRHIEFLVDFYHRFAEA